MGADTSAAMQALNTSVAVDCRLWREDIQGSIAHARGLAKAGVISEAEAKTLQAGLEQVAQEIERGTLVWDPKKEDVHMNIEARLTDYVGAVGVKLHTVIISKDKV